MRASLVWIAGGLLMTGCAYAQEPGTLPEGAAPQTQSPPQSQPPSQTTTPMADPNTPPNAIAVERSAGSSPSMTPPPGSGRFTVPAGTKILLSIKSAVNTRTARPGDSVYLESTFPVVVDGHVLIPPGVYVQGILDRVVRPGRIKGRAEVGMHFTSMIFPNGTAVEIPGVVNSLPGAANQRVKDPEGTIQQSGTKGKDAGNIAKAAGTGAGVGTIGGAATGSPLAGAGYGAAAGAVAGGLYTLFTRGDEVAIQQGTVIEMVLQRPLQLEEQTYGPGGQNQPQNQQQMVPRAGQQQPMAKPIKQQLLCPAWRPWLRRISQQANASRC